MKLFKGTLIRVLIVIPKFEHLHTFKCVNYSNHLHHRDLLYMPIILE